MARYFSIAAVFVAACGGGAVPGPAPAPAPVPEPAVAAPAPSSASTFAFAYQPGRFTARVHGEGTSVVADGATTDSQSVRNDAVLTLDAIAEGGILRFVGSLDSLSVTPTHLPGAGTGYVRLLLPLAFRGLVPVSGHVALSVGADSTGACWSEARVVLDPLHSVFPAVPSPLREGASWRDSTEIRTCRLGIPVIVREVRTLRLDRIAGDGGSLEGHVSYTTVTITSGRRTDGAVQTVYAGAGESNGTLILDAVTGIVRRDENEGRYRLSIALNGSERVLTQRARRVIELTPRN